MYSSCFKTLPLQYRFHSDHYQTKDHYQTNGHCQITDHDQTIFVPHCLCRVYEIRISDFYSVFFLFRRNIKNLRFSAPYLTVSVTFYEQLLYSQKGEIEKSYPCVSGRNFMVYNFMKNLICNHWQKYFTFWNKNNEMLVMYVTYRYAFTFHHHLFKKKKWEIWYRKRFLFRI